MKHCLPLWLLLFLLLQLPSAARATAGPPATGRSLAEALNPDGTLRAGAAGSFDARQFRMGTAPDGRPVFRPMGTGDERWQSGFGLPDGVEGAVWAVVRAGADMYIGGDFTLAGSVSANHVVRWDGTAWSSLGTGAANGVNGTVNALAAAPNGDVYVGGSFTQAGGSPANCVARWNGTAWSPLGTGAANGLSSTTNALAVAPNGDVYAGGNFRLAGGSAANYVARWDGTAWSPLGTGTANGTNNWVYALAVASNGNVYAGGDFSVAGNKSMGYVGRVGRWDGTGWNALGSGMATANSQAVFPHVYALAVAANGDVYAGGYFSKPASNVARWNGANWSNLGNGGMAPGSDGTNGSVYALALASNGDLYAAGGFNQVTGIAAAGLARWNGTGWSPLGTGALGGGGFDAVAVAANGDVYAGGTFTQIGSLTANRVARWAGAAWQALAPGPGAGLNGTVNAVAVAANGDVYVGGSFTQAGSVFANRVAKWNGTAWSALGTGVDAMTTSAGPAVDALAVAPNGDVYAVGSFAQAGGITVNNIAKWNGSNWSALGTGTNYPAQALAIAPNGDVYIGGGFAEAGGITARGIAHWNGTAWRGLGTILAASTRLNRVYALAVAANGDVYVGANLRRPAGAA